MLYFNIQHIGKVYAYYAISPRPRWQHSIQQNNFFLAVTYYYFFFLCLTNYTLCPIKFNKISSFLENGAQKPEEAFFYFVWNDCHISIANKIIIIKMKKKRQNRKINCNLKFTKLSTQTKLLPLDCFLKWNNIYVCNCVHT